MAASENMRSIHAGVVVALARAASVDSRVAEGIRTELDRYCDQIRSGSDELTDVDVESLRFLTVLRTELQGAEPAS